MSTAEFLIGITGLCAEIQGILVIYYWVNGLELLSSKFMNKMPLCCGYWVVRGWRWANSVMYGDIYMNKKRAQRLFSACCYNANVS